MMLVHSMHQLCMRMDNRFVNQRNLKEYILVKGWKKELHPLNVKNVVIKTPKCILSSLGCPKLLQGIRNT
jgi:hypothetical protein